jgi:hypothetical protein
MSPVVTHAHHIARNDHRNGLGPEVSAVTCDAPALRPPRRKLLPRRLEGDVLGPFEPQDRTGVIGGGDRKTQSFDDLARLQDLGGI